MRSYFESIADYYFDTPLPVLDPDAVHQVKRCLVDFLGCGLLGASMEGSGPVPAFLFAMDDGTQKADMWGVSKKISAPLAAFANSYFGGILELDDAMALGASVHPGASVIPAALAAAQETDCDGACFLHAVIFGYDVCNRMGLLSTAKVRELGLYGPGLVGALASASAAGMLYGLTSKQLADAVSIAASLSPVCPFINFIDGAEVKNIYCGWSSYLGILAVKMAQKGIPGSKRVLDGPKSLASIYAGQRGLNVSPREHNFALDVVFKDFSACRSVHATLTAIAQLQKQNNIDVEKVERIGIRTYPYAVDLSDGVERLNPISARLHLPYTAAVMLCTGKLEARSFSEGALGEKTVRALMEKIYVQRHPAYDAGPFGVRGSEVTVTLTDGTMLQAEVHHARWDKEAPPSDAELINKFRRLTEGILCAQARDRLPSLLFALEKQPDLEPVFACLRMLERREGDHFYCKEDLS
ncbi:MAG TPA: MmgE/PrpD family protein [Clostridia bacterium]|nr:MmgE/PrpD family protein [Clostridia bacterium]